MPRPSILTEPTQFPGFEPLSANFVYCPNQFFDVCLPNCSRGTVRLVAYLLRRTLGWLDKNGLPIEQQISVTYQELVNRAGISRAAIRKAVDEAVDAGFIVCIRPGRSDTRERPAETACYQLRWDEENPYTSDPGKFRGFFAREGNRSPIPNAFFDQVIPFETLAVTKIVGTVLRFTVGYENQFGKRREQAPLSYSFIQHYAKIADRSTLADAIRRSMEIGYIRCVEEGCFDKSSRSRATATYAVKWLDQAASGSTGSKTRPVTSDRFKKQTSSGSRTRPEKRSKNQTIEKTDEKDTSKQQQLPSAAVDHAEGFQLLRAENFDEQAARRLARLRSADEIQQQIKWIEYRRPDKNRLGMLRRAIEENWSQPEGFTDKEKLEQRQKRERQQQALRAEEGIVNTKTKKQRLDRRQALLSRWRALTPDERRNTQQRAIERATSELQRRRLRTTDLDDPPTAILRELQLGTSTPLLES